MPELNDFFTNHEFYHFPFYLYLSFKQLFSSCIIQLLSEKKSVKSATITLTVILLRGGESLRHLRMDPSNLIRIVPA